jgi:hypothetical protein
MSCAKSQHLVDFLRLLHGPWAKGKRITAVITGYFDGSGSHEESQVFCIAGFIAEADTWVTFNEKWQAILDRPEWPSRVTEMHMYDCVHGEREFSSWTYAQRLSLFGECSTAIMSSNIHAIGSSVYIGDLALLNPDDLAILKWQRVGDPADLVFQHLMQRLIHQTLQHFPGDEQVGLTFDIEPEKSLQYHELYNRYAAGFPRAERYS